MLAYIDPGSGSLVLQVLLGAVLGAVFTLKTYWRKIKAAILSGFSTRT